MMNCVNASFGDASLWQMSCTCSSMHMSPVGWNPSFFAVVENHITLCQNARDINLHFLRIYLDV